MHVQKGFAHLLLLLMVVVALAALAYVYFAKQHHVLPGTAKTKAPAVTLKTAYKNPFDKNAQYVNPFNQYKSPLLSLK